MGFVDATLIVLGLAFLIGILLETILLALSAMVAYGTGFNLKKGFMQWLILLFFRIVLIVLMVFAAKGMGLIGKAAGG